jgi:2,3-bisphosphoglycerate-dependent phosphoglycerate mutase
LQTTLLLIRHGESTWNREGRVQGWLDPPLSERGVQQAVLLAERLREQPIDALYASPLQRARATAQAIADLKALPLRVDDRLREHRLGGIQGLTSDEIASKFPQLHARVGQTNLWVGAPDEEPLEEFSERMRLCGSELAERHAGQTIAVVTHGGSINRLLMAWLGIAVLRHPVFHLDNTSLTRVRLRGALVQLMALNDCSHLRELTAPVDLQSHW